jgi:hypothetical protein
VIATSAESESIDVKKDAGDEANDRVDAVEEAESKDEDEAFMDAVLDDVVNEFAPDNEGTTRDENSIAQAVAAVAAATSPELDVESCREDQKKLLNRDQETEGDEESEDGFNYAMKGPSEHYVGGDEEEDDYGSDFEIPMETADLSSSFADSNDDFHF